MGLERLLRWTFLWVGLGGSSNDLLGSIEGAASIRLGSPYRPGQKQRKRLVSRAAELPGVFCTILREHVYGALVPAAKRLPPPVSAI